MHSRSTCSIGCPKPRSTPSDKAATSSASRTFALVVGVVVAAVILGTIRRPLHRDEAEVQSVSFATSPPKRVLPGSPRVLVAVAASGRAALAPHAAPAADRDPGVSGCRRCSSHPSSRRLGHWRRPPLYT